MPIVTLVKSARKDNSVCKKGESYYWWKFRYGRKRLSLTYPKRSQLTQSNFLSQLYDLQDNMEFDRAELEMSRDGITEQIQCLRDECQESLDNIPEHLQCAPTGELIQERIDALESWESEFENVDIEFDEDLTAEEKEERTDELIQELENCEFEL